MKNLIQSTISKEEVEEAIQSFLSKGGKIKVLPQQRIPRNFPAASEGKYDIYESIFELNGLLGR